MGIFHLNLPRSPIPFIPCFLLSDFTGGRRISYAFTFFTCQIFNFWSYFILECLFSLSFILVRVWGRGRRSTYSSKRRTKRPDRWELNIPILPARRQISYLFFAFSFYRWAMIFVLFIFFTCEIFDFRTFSLVLESVPSLSFF